MIELADILNSFEGKASFALNLKGKEAAVIYVEGKEIIADVKDAFAFLDFGLLHDLMKKKSESKTMQRLKDAGFKISLKYKGFKVDL